MAGRGGNHQRMQEQALRLEFIGEERPSQFDKGIEIGRPEWSNHLAHRLSRLARNQRELIKLLERWVETGAASRVHTSD